MNKIKQKFLPLNIVIFVTVILYLINLIFFWQYGMSSDSVIATMCSDIIYKEGISSFIDNYISQQAIMPLYFIYYLPFLVCRYITSDLIIVTKFGMLFHQILLIFSAYYLLKQLKVRKECSIVFSFFLSSMSSSWFLTFMMFDPFYMIPMYLSFFLFSIVLKIFERKNKNSIRIVLIIIIIMYTCVVDLRLGSIFCAPFLLACVLKFVIENYNNSIFEVKVEIIKYLNICLPIGLASVLALLLREKISDLFFINQGRNGSFVFDTLKNMQTNFSGLLVSIHDIVGHTESGTQVLSLNGVLWFVSTLVAVFLMIVFPALLCKSYKKLKDSIKLYLLFYIINFLLNVGIIIVSTWISMTMEVNSSAVGRFMLPTLCLAIILFAVYLSEEKVLCDYRLIKNICIIGMMMIFLIHSFSYMYHLSLSGKVAYEVKQELLNYLKENNCYDGFATYWNASINTVISKDKVNVRPIKIDTQGNIIPFCDLSSKAWFKEMDNENAFLILSEEEYRNLNKNDGIDNYIISENYISGYYVIICQSDWINDNVAYWKKSDSLMNKLSSNMEFEDNKEININYGQFVDYMFYYPILGIYNLNINLDIKEDNLEWNMSLVVVKNKNGVEKIEEYNLNKGSNSVSFICDNTYDFVRVYILNNKMLDHSVILSNFTYLVTENKR